MTALGPCDYFCHHLRGNWGEQDAVAEMAGGYVIARTGGCAENRQPVGSSGAQASPVFEDLCIAQVGDDGNRRAIKTLNRLDISALVESCFFHRGSHQDSSVAARNQVYLRSAYYVLEQIARG